MKIATMIQLMGAGVALVLATSCASTGRQVGAPPQNSNANPYGGGWSQGDADYVQVTPTGQGGGGGYAATQDNPYSAYQGGGGGGYADYSSYSQGGGGGGGGAYAAPNYGGAPSASAPSYSAPAPSSGARTYTVQKGDTLYRISRTHGTSVDALMAANNMGTTNIFPGDVLRLP